MNKAFLTIVWRITLLGIAGFLVWKIITINYTDHLVELAAKGDQEALDQALTWDSSHPRVLTLHAIRLLESGQESEASEYLVAAIGANPADAKPLMLLADIRRRGGEVEVADQMVETANRLMPVDADIQRLIAAYWYARDRLELVVPHLSTALTADRRYRDELFPIFLQIAENRNARKTLAPIADDPPKWWDDFAVYATKNAKDIDSLRVVAAMRKQSEKAPISDRERNAYIDRLKKEGLLAEAYLHWVHGLDKQERQHLAYLYNGSFEREFSNSGFGWHTWLPKNSGMVISTATTYGIVGNQALYLSFRGKRIRFYHLHQSLFLNPGVYRFTGNVRPDKLKARRGLQWVVNCSEGAKGSLGKSEEFQGSGDWRSFEFEITVPDECEGQVLRLRSVGEREVDFEIVGEIWFDDLRIRLQNSQ